MSKIFSQLDLLQEMEISISRTNGAKQTSYTGFAPQRNSLHSGDQFGSRTFVVTDT